MRARDLMVPLGESLTPEMTLKEAARLLRRAGGGGGLPVLDARGLLVGFLSIGDLLKAAVPSYLATTGLGELSWDGMLEGVARKLAGRLVGAVMTTAVISVREEDPLMVCADHMVRHGVERLPVVGPDGRVCGILYERDVFAAVTDAMLGAAGEPPA